MADTDPTGGGSTVALTISADDRNFLRRIFKAARDGVRTELAEYPEQLQKATAAHLHREEAVYDKLLAALDTGSIVPDRDVRDVLRDLADNVIDVGNEYARVVAEHEALYGLLGQITEGGNR